MIVPSSVPISSDFVLIFLSVEFSFFSKETRLFSNTSNSSSVLVSR